jgi:phosphoribosylaminoimidazole-succinocarboxamide synthase
MNQALFETNFNFPNQQNKYKGKVRDVYSIGTDVLVMVATDRISAFDVVLPRPIPEKGRILNSLALHFMEATKDIVQNWIVASPDPNVSIGKRCIPFKVEMVIRGYLSGHAWREYSAGKRQLCGVQLPDGLKESDPFPNPIITPATKADEGHDEDISREEIIKQGIVSESDYIALEKYTRALYQRGTEMAAERGLILVDTKYEFGKDSDGNICLIDEIHTPDSSRYFYKEGYELRQQKGERQKQLSKEFVREWLMENGFRGREGEQVPTMPDSFVKSVTDRYTELYTILSGKQLQPISNESINERIEKNVKAYLEKM